MQLFSELAYFELRTGHSDEAIETVERGLKSGSNSVQLHGVHAGNPGDARRHRQTYRDRRAEKHRYEYTIFTIHYRSLLCKCLQVSTGPRHSPLLDSLPWPPDFKARLNLLLARCYGHLGEPEQQHQAYLRALSADPKNVKAKLGLIDGMVKRGELDEAISEYRLLRARVPAVGLFLAQLLIGQNRQKPAKERDWSEVKTAR